MSRLLREIRRHSPEAAEVLEQEGLCTDSDIESLTREELHELLPGRGKFKLRRSLFDIIHKQNQSPVKQLLREMKNFIPDESFQAALSHNGVLVQYLHILKDIKTQLNEVQHFLDAHICVLEEPSTNQPDQELATCGQLVPRTGQTDGSPQGAPDSLPGTSSSDASGPTKGQPRSFSGESISAGCGPLALCTGQTDGRPQEAEGEPFTILSPLDMAETSLMYRVVVGGITFRAHEQLIQNLKARVWRQDLHLIERSQDHEITFVFCPISSRIETDVEAAMRPVKDDKPVILVLMHHTREVKFPSTLRTKALPDNVVLHVNVFYHDTMHGLLKCPENEFAVSKIQKILLERFIQRSKDNSGNAQGVGAKSGLTDTVVTNSNKSTYGFGSLKNETTWSSFLVRK